MKPLCAATILAFCIAPVSASADTTYRAEFSLSGTSFRDDAQTKSSRTEASASRYFTALPLNPDYPLAETTFVERAGGLEVAYARGSFEDSVFEKTTDVADTSVALRLAGKNVPLTATLALRKIDFGQLQLRNGFLRVAIEEKISQVDLGYFVRPRMHLSVERELSTTSYELVPAVMTLPDFEVETLTLAGRYLAQSDEGHFTLNGSIASIDQGPNRLRNREVEFGGRNYLDKKQHIGVWVGLNSGDDRSDEGQWVRLSYGNFLTSAIEIFGLFEKFLAVDRNAGSDHDAAVLGASIRF